VISVQYNIRTKIQPRSQTSTESVNPWAEEDEFTWKRICNMKALLQHFHSRQCKITEVKAHLKSASMMCKRYLQSIKGALCSGHVSPSVT
jgi:hypothetical protein